MRACRRTGLEHDSATPFLMTLIKNPIISFTSMAMVEGDEYVCFISHCFESSVEIVFGFPESENGLRNLQELAKPHIPIFPPPSTRDAMMGPEGGSDNEESGPAVKRCKLEGDPNSEAKE